MYDPILDCFFTLAHLPRLLVNVAAVAVPCACSISCIAVEQSGDTVAAVTVSKVAAVEADALFPRFVISTSSVVLAVDGSGRADTESESIQNTSAVTETEPKPKTAVFCQNRREPKPRFFWCQLSGFDQGNFGRRVV